MAPDPFEGASTRAAVDQAYYLNLGTNIAARHGMGQPGAWLLLRRPVDPLARWWALVAVIFILVMTGAHVVLLAVFRYAYPALVLVMLFASIAVDRLLGSRPHRRQVAA